MASFQGRNSFLFALGLLCSLAHIQSSLATLYKVGDIGGKWGSENYFQVGDSLSFSDHTKSTSVHQVSRADYKACETTTPIKTYNDGSSVVDLNQESTYYFISGVKSHCRAGRKLAVTVLATSPAPTSPASSPAAATPTVPAPVPSVSPTPTAFSPAPSPVSTPPTSLPPAPSPVSTTTPPAPSVTPATPPTPATAPTPSSAPSSQPSAPGSTPATGPPTPPPGPASPPSPPSAASFTDLRSSIVAAAAICSGLVLLL